MDIIIELNCVSMASHGSVSASKVQPSPWSCRSSESTSNTSQLPSKLKIKVIFLICSEAVEDQVGKKRGHDAIFCNGNCQECAHWQCAGLSKVSFLLHLSQALNLHPIVHYTSLINFLLSCFWPENPYMYLLLRLKFWKISCHLSVYLPIHQHFLLKMIQLLLQLL